MVFLKKKNRYINENKTLNPNRFKDKKKEVEKYIKKNFLIFFFNENKWKWIDIQNNILDLTKRKINPKVLINQRFGTFWKIINKKLSQINPNKEKNKRKQISLLFTELSEWKRNNQVQMLEIKNLIILKKKQIKSEVIQSLIKGSLNLKQKNIFQKEKQFSKKQNKITKEFQLVRCDPYTMTIAYFTKKPNRILNIRYDTISQILTSGNVQSGKKLIILEECSGLLTLCCVHKMGGYGQILHGTSENKEGLNCLYNFLNPSIFIRRIIKSFDLSLFFNYQNYFKEFQSNIHKISLYFCSKFC